MCVKNQQILLEILNNIGENLSTHKYCTNTRGRESREISTNKFSNQILPCLSYFADARATSYLNSHRVTYPCKNCGKVYSYYSSLARHLRHECGVEPKFHCPLCPYRTKHKSSLNTHLNGRHMKLLSDFYTLPDGRFSHKMTSLDSGN